MALTIKQLTNYSWMSQASYLDFIGLAYDSSSDRLEALLKQNTLNPDNVLSPEQAAAFIGSNTADPNDGFNFVSHAPNYQDTGFSTAVFKSNTVNIATFSLIHRKAA